MSEIKMRKVRKPLDADDVSSQSAAILWAGDKVKDTEVVPEQSHLPVTQKRKAKSKKKRRVGIEVYETDITFVKKWCKDNGFTMSGAYIKGFRLLVNQMLK